MAFLSSCSFVPEPYQDLTLDLSAFGGSRAATDGFSGAVGFFGPLDSKLSYFTNDYGGITSTGGDALRYNITNFAYPAAEPGSSIPSPYFPEGQFWGFVVDPGSTRVNLYRLPAAKNIRAVLHLYTDGSELVSGYGGFPGWGNSVTYKAYVSEPFDLLPFTPTVVDFRNAQPMGTYTVQYPAEIAPTLPTTPYTSGVLGSTMSSVGLPGEYTKQISDLDDYVMGVGLDAAQYVTRLSFTINTTGAEVILQRATDPLDFSNQGQAQTVTGTTTLSAKFFPPIKAQYLRLRVKMPVGNTFQVTAVDTKIVPFFGFE